MRIVTLFTVLACVSACSAVDVSSELDIMDRATSRAADNTLRELSSQIDQAEAEAPLRAAQANERWQITGACIENERVGDFSSLDDCQVQKTRLNDPDAGLSPEQVFAQQLVDVRRKLAALKEYTALLALLASSETEDEIQLAFGGLAGAVNNLGDAVERDSLKGFAEKLRAREDKVDAIVSFAVANYRSRLMRQTVSQAHPAIVDITGELKAKLEELGADGQYLQARQGMFDANRAARTAFVGDDVFLRADAYRELEAAHARFIDVAEDSIYTQLDNLAAAHAGLAKRLARRPSGDEVHAYLKSLQSLAKTLEVEL